MQSTKTVLIISNNPELYATKALVQSIKLKELEVEIYNLEQLKINTDKLNDFLFVINRNTGLNYKDEDLDILSKYCKVPLINPVSCSKILRDKFEQYRYFKDILRPEAIIETKELMDNSQFQTATSKWIIKTMRGQKGFGIRTSTNLVHDRNEIIATGDLNYIVQPYIEMKCEWRVICIGKDQKIIIRKSPKNAQDEFHILSFKNSQTQNVTTECAPKSVLEITKDITTNLKYHFITVDILEGIDGSFKFLEANSSAGMAHTDAIIGEQGLANLLINEMLKYLNS